MPDLEMLSLLHQTLGLPIDFPSIEPTAESIEPTLPDESLVFKKSYSSKQPFSLKRHYLSFYSSFVWSIFFLSIINTKMKRLIDSTLFETTNRLYHTPCRIRGQFHRTLGM